MAEKTNAGIHGVATAQVKITKTEAVKRSLAKLGKGAMPKALQADVKKRFGLDVTPDYAGKIKTEVLGKGGGTKKATEPAPHQSPQVARNGKAPSVLLADILTIKDLVQRVGAKHLRTLIDAMSR